MKLVMLVDSSTQNFEDMIDSVGDKQSVFIDTNNCDEVNEYKYLVKSVNHFSQSENEIMLAKFSGRENVIRNLGEECPEMILTVSDKKSSKYYTECPKKTFLNLIQIFEQEII